MKKKKLLAKASTLCLVLALATPLFMAVSAKAEPKVIKLSFAHFFTAAHHMTESLAMWAKNVEKATDGKVKITIYNGQTLLKAPETYDGVTKGVADIGYHPVPYTRGRFPLLEVFDAPGIPYNNDQVASRVVWEVYKKFEPLKELSETKVLAITAIASGILATKKPVRKLEDLQDMRIRVTGLMTDCMKALGAVPIGITMPESYEALSKGVVSGVLNIPSAHHDWKTEEVTSYYTFTPFIYSAGFVLVMNLNKWSSLPEDIRHQIEMVSADFIPWLADRNEGFEKVGLKAGLSRGIEMILLPEEEKARWIERLKPISDAMVEEREAKGLPAREFLNEILRLCEKYSNEYPKREEILRLK
jgi:TRAP-type C4-dicarboxylate transport system substrate-binding protein